MYIRIGASIILMLLLSVVQVGFVSALPSWLSNINFVLIVLIMIHGFGNFRMAVLWALLVGALVDFYSFDFYGLYTVSYVLTLFVINYLLENFLTNRSLYTFLSLAVVGTLVFEVLVFLLNDLRYLLLDNGLLRAISLDFWMDEFSKVVVNVLVAFFLFQTINFFSARFKPIFLIK